MKKIISLLIGLSMILSLGVSVRAATFTDLSADHWAYQNISTLVSEGTVNGYEDGSFRPSKTVTRAEFVKMLGKWDRAYQGTYPDLSPSHWAYEYIMWSGLEPKGANILPDTEMLREDVINLIWKRNGSPKHNGAPYAIASQGKNQDAVSWAYTIGLVQGDDGYNLRLDRVLSRAEAATLIVRARTLVAENKQYNFVDLVSDDLLKQVVRTTQVFGDKPYNPAQTLTYGEIARAAMSLGTSGLKLTYSAADLYGAKLIEHEYAKDMYVLTTNVWGKSLYNVKQTDKNAVVQDALSAMVYGLVRRGGELINLGALDTYYGDCLAADSTAMENLCLSYAKENGIKLYAGTKLNAYKEVTMRDVAALLLQLDVVTGLELSYDNDTKYNTKINKDIASYPANAADYKAVLAGVPNAVYNLKQAETKPSSYYGMANEMSFVFTAYLKDVEFAIKTDSGIKARFTFYPSLTYDENGKIVYIAKCILQSEGKEAINLDTVFAKYLKSKTTKTVAPNREFYVAFETYGPLMDIYLPSSAAYVKSIIIPD